MGYSYSGLGITEYTEFQFRKERSWIWKRNTHGGGDLRTTSKRPRRIFGQNFPKRTRILSIPSKPYSFHSVHSAIWSRMNGMIFRSFRKRNSSQKNTNTVYSEYSYSLIVPKERALRCQLSIWNSVHTLTKWSKTEVFLHEGTLSTVSNPRWEDVLSKNPNCSC